MTDLPNYIAAIPIQSDARRAAEEAYGQRVVQQARTHLEKAVRLLEGLPEPEWEAFVAASMANDTITLTELRHLARVLHDLERVKVTP